MDADRTLVAAGSPKPQGGRPRVSNRQTLMGILFVLRTGCPWEYLPKELGCGSGMTCWRRLRDWHAAGVWEKVWRVLLDELGLAHEIDWSKVAIDSCSVRALFGGANRPQSHGSRQKWLEAACCLRWPGNAVGYHAHRRERPRFSSSGPIDRRDSSDQASWRWPPQTSRRSLRRSRLRRRRKNPRAFASARHPAVYRQAKHGTRKWLGRSSLRCRMGLQLVIQIPPPSRALRKTRRYSYRFPHHRLPAHLLEPIGRVLLESLRLKVRPGAKGASHSNR